MESRVSDLPVRSNGKGSGRMINAPVGMAGARRFVGGAGMALMAVALFGCATITEHFGDMVTVSPAKLEYYTCKDIEHRAKAVRTRQTELEQLMARSAQGPGGEFINMIAYRTDYLKANGELKVLVQVASDKHCATTSPLSSARSLL
jgi:hypothetical protein